METAMSWRTEIEPLDGGRVRRVRVYRGEELAAYAEVIEGWQREAGFRAKFVDTLATAPFATYFWETPPVTRNTATRPFEFVLVDAPALASMPPDPDAFARHFQAAGTGADVAAFANLGGDTFLVAPTPRAAADAYPHIAAFSRTAALDQQHAFWRAVGQAMAAHLGDRPLWLSTSGLGIAWLHARLDPRPKYYTFEPYRHHLAKTQGDTRP